MLLIVAPLLHNTLLIAVTLIILGFLGMLLQRNAHATIFSLLLWLQGIGLVFIAYSQNQSSQMVQFYFLIIMLVMITLLSTMAALIYLNRRISEKSNSCEPQSVSETREGIHPGG